MHDITSAEIKKCQEKAQKAEDDKLHFVYEFKTKK